MKDYARYPSLAGKMVLITGGASGIGAEMVRGFMRQGAKVGFVDLDEQSARCLLDEVSGAGARMEDIRFEPCDLRSIDGLKEAFDRLHSSLGPAHVLINNAANDDRHDWLEVTPDYFDERIEVNFRHVYFAIQAVAPEMIAAGGGAIINMSSYSWVEGAPNLSIYAAANAAIQGLTRSFARELGPHRIRVNSIIPGWIMTERQRTKWLTEEKLKGYLKRQCLPDPVEPVHVANMALFLASSDAAMCSGGDFFVTGGVLAT